MARRLLQYAGSFLLIILIVTGVRIFCAGSYRISTGSMEKVLQKGDLVLVNKIHSSSNPGRNRVVLFESPLREDAGAASLFLSRCLGMPGDTIRITHDGYHVNGRLLPDFSTSERAFHIQKDIKAPLLDLLTRLQIPFRSVAEDGQRLTIRLTSGEERMIREHLPQLVKMEPVPEDAWSYAFVIPFKGYVYRPDSVSLTLYEDILRKETGGKASVRDGKLFLDEKKAVSFLFRENYYWMLSDHAEEAVDSRHLGLIPAHAVVGNVWFCWYSKNKKHFFKQIN
ncbi:MAG: signal peptidase I [Tannerella sp.]|jgi:signal peptidase I|nr:signal peptidase I [Tannerella sp.]